MHGCLLRASRSRFYATRIFNVVNRIDGNRILAMVCSCGHPSWVPTILRRGHVLIKMHESAEVQELFEPPPSPIIWAGIHCPASFLRLNSFITVSLETQFLLLLGRMEDASKKRVRRACSSNKGFLGGARIG